MMCIVIAIAIVLDTIDAARMVAVDLVAGKVTMATRNIVVTVATEAVMAMVVLTATTGTKTKI